MKTSQVKISIFQIAEKLFGKNFVRKLYTNHCTRLFQEAGVIFIHIPKVGGTSIAHKLFGKRAGHDSALKVKDVLGEDAFKKMYSFSVVRNPYDRLVSAYHYAIQGGGSDGGIRRRPVYRTNLFATFSMFVHNWLILQDPEEIEIIFRPQHYFICDKEDNILVKWVGKIENIDEVEHRISAELGKPIKLSRRNTTRRKHYSKYYDEELQQLVYNYFKRDFELFGYPKQIEGLN